MPPTKKQMTEVFLAEAGLDVTPEKVNQYIWTIWFNPIHKHSMRLTDAGCVFLTNSVKLEHYDYTLKESKYSLASRIYILLDKHMTVPFWLGPRKKIVLFGEVDAIMLALHGNDLTAYLETFS